MVGTMEVFIIMVDTTTFIIIMEGIITEDTLIITIIIIIIITEGIITEGIITEGTIITNNKMAIEVLS